MIEHPTKSNFKTSKMFSTRSISIIQRSWILEFLLDYWIELNLKNPIIQLKSNKNPRIKVFWIIEN
jgi:hypothetical protein